MNNQSQISSDTHSTLSPLRRFLRGGQVISIRRQITLVFLALFIAVQTGLIIANYLSSRSTVEGSINTGLDQAVMAYEKIITNQLENLYLQAELIAKDFGFKQAFATGEKATVQSALDNVLRRGDTDIALAIDLDGDILAQAGSTDVFSFPSEVDVDMLTDWSARQQKKPIFVTSGQITYEMAVVPVRSPVLMGFVAFAKALDDHQAKHLMSFSAFSLNIAFLYQADGWQVSGLSASRDLLTNFTDQAQGYDLATMSQTVRYQNNPVGASLFGTLAGSEEFILRVIPLGGAVTGGKADPLQQTIDENASVMVLFVSLDQAMDDFLVLFLALFGAGVAGVVILFFGSFFIASRVSQPIQAVSEAATDIARGNYNPMDVKWNYREVHQLSSSFNSMIRAVEEREHKIRYQATHDSETELPNGQYLHDEMGNLLAKEAPFSLVIAEIHNFHDLRVVLEHGQLIELLKQAGHRLQKITGTAVARLSSDSFGFILTDIGASHDVMQAIVDGFMNPVVINDLKVDLIIHMGMAMSPMDGKYQHELLLNTHSALDQARVSGENFVHCTADHKASHDTNLSMMSDLRSELAEGHVSFAFQPKLDLKTDQLMGAEALIRWHSPKHGFVPPDDFISMAERTGDIKHLTSWTLGEVIAQAAKWNKDQPRLIAINLSTRDLQNESLPDLLHMITVEYDVDPKTICLEVTESAVMGDMKRALKILNALSDMGFYLSIDDYGTGYSSLAYIKKLPVQELKIDKAFVLNLADSPEDQILVQSTVELAHNLGMKVTAEGVEDAQSLALLKSYGCDVAQGYYIARPLPIPEFEAFWQDHGSAV